MDWCLSLQNCRTLHSVRKRSKKVSREKFRENTHVVFLGGYIYCMNYIGLLSFWGQKIRHFCCFSFVVLPKNYMSSHGKEKAFMPKGEHFQRFQVQFEALGTNFF